MQGYSELTAEDSERIAGELSEKFGWEINPLACESRYQALKEEGRVDEKGKGKARQK